jgi:hypothetical protein
MVGESFIAVVATSGAVQRVEGLSRLSDKMFANLPPEAAPMLAGLRQGLSDDVMKLNMSQALVKFPDRALKPGESWDDKMTTPNPMMGPVTISTTSTLKAIEGAAGKQMARIASTLTLRQDSAAPGAGPMGMTVKMDEAKGDREVVFDIAQGRTQKVTTNMAMPMAISGTAPDGTALNMRSATRSVTTLELLQ